MKNKNISKRLQVLVFLALMFLPLSSYAQISKNEYKLKMIELAQPCEEHGLLYKFAGVWRVLYEWPCNKLPINELRMF